MTRASAHCLLDRNGVDHLDRLWKTTLALLGEHQLAVEGHLEDPVASFDQLRLVTETLLDFVRQTGGSGQVVSNHTVFNLNLGHLRITPKWE